MSTPYPYQARSLMRFQAQDGQFTINVDQVITVTAPTENAPEWLDVTDAHGVSSSIPAGFLIPIEPETLQETHQQHSLSDPPVSQPRIAPDDPAPSDDRLPSPSSATSASIEQTSDNVPNVSTSQALLSPPVNQTLPFTEGASHVSSSSQILNESNTPSNAPPPAAKPNALRDRIAMFNKTAPPPASPPGNRLKPVIARKPINASIPAPSLEATQETLTAPIAYKDDETPRVTTQPGMSAADAEESVKASGSLKDRIRLLQQQQTVVSDVSSIPAKPKREWKRPPPPPADEPIVPIPIGLPPSIQCEVIVGEDASPGQLDAEPVSNPIDDKPDQLAEEELVRRQKIAERMAKLGGAKMGFGFPGPALGPKPKVSPKESTDAEILAQPPTESTSEESSTTSPPERIAMPIIPKRAPPPRRKAPSPANNPASSDASHADIKSLPAQASDSHEGSETSMRQASCNDELPILLQHETPVPIHLSASSVSLLEDPPYEVGNYQGAPLHVIGSSTLPQREADTETIVAHVAEPDDNPIVSPAERSADNALSEEPESTAPEEYHEKVAQDAESKVDAEEKVKKF